MPKFTVWMAGDGDPSSYNWQPHKYDEIEAEDFIKACQYVRSFYFLEDRWILEFDNGNPFLRHIYRGWRYGLYQTKQEAYDATFGKIEAQKIETYRNMKGIPEGELVNLKCWERFAIPYVKDSGENIDFIYACYPMRKCKFVYETKSPLDIHIPATYVPFSILESCVNCPMRNSTDGQLHE